MSQGFGPLADRPTRPAVGLEVSHESAEIIYVRNATEAVNLVAYSWARTNLRAGDPIVLTHMEHHANVVPWQILAEERGVEIRWIPLTADFRLDLTTPHFGGAMQPSNQGPYLADQRLNDQYWQPPQKGYFRISMPANPGIAANASFASPSIDAPSETVQIVTRSFLRNLSAIASPCAWGRADANGPLLNSTFCGFKCDSPWPVYLL